MTATNTSALAGILDKHEHAVRVCPERDARCPHGMECPHVISRYQCDMAASRRAIALLSNQDDAP